MLAILAGWGVTCVPSCWTDFGSSLSHCLDFSGALYGVEELRTWNWKLWRLVLSGLVWPGCAWGAFCLVRVAGYLSFGAAKISRKLILWRILPQVWVEAMNFYFIPGSEDPFGMSGILFKLLIRQLSRLLWISRRTGPSDLVRGWMLYVLKAWAVRV